MKNSIIIGISIIIAGIIIAIKLPRYQYTENTTRVVNKDGTQSEEVDACILDMVSGESYSKHIVIVTSEDGKVISVGHKNSHDSKHTKLETWKKQYEIFGNKFLTGNEWEEWKKNNKW